MLYNATIYETITEVPGLFTTYYDFIVLPGILPNKSVFEIRRNELSERFEVINTILISKEGWAGSSPVLEQTILLRDNKQGEDAAMLFILKYILLEESSVVNDVKGFLVLKGLKQSLEVPFNTLLLPRTKDFICIRDTGYFVKDLKVVAGKVFVDYYLSMPKREVYKSFH